MDSTNYFIWQNVEYKVNYRIINRVDNLLTN